jgi:hypothetical protein
MVRLRVRPSALATIVASSVALAGCYSLAEPSLRPGDSRDVMAALTRHGVVVGDIVVGEAACDDRDLIENALHLTVTGADDPAPVDLFMYLFRVRGWEGSAEAVDDCQAEYAAGLDPAAVVRRVDVPTYRAFGADWSDGLTDAVRDALEEAATQGS